MAEQSCKKDRKLHQLALNLAIRADNEFMQILIKGMNPDALSPADIDTLRDYLEEE